MLEKKIERQRHQGFYRPFAFSLGRGRLGVLRGHFRFVIARGGGPHAKLFESDTSSRVTGDKSFVLRVYWY